MSDDRQVLIKEMLFARAPDIKSLELFEREAQVLGRINLPGIPRYYDHFTEAGVDGLLTRYFLVQEYLPGRNLRDEAKAGRIFDEMSVRDFLAQMLPLLHQLHILKPPVIHRDVKPSNILRLEGGGWALVDFGAVQQKLADLGGGSTVAGTSGYMPVEQLMGRARAVSDLYALGATAIFMLSRREPAEMQQDDLALGFLPFVNISASFARFLMRCCALDPEDRFESCAAAFQALHAMPMPEDDIEELSMPAGKPRRARSGPASFGAPASPEDALQLFSYWPDDQGGAADISWLEQIDAPAQQILMVELAEQQFREGKTLGQVGRYHLIARTAAQNASPHPGTSTLNIVNAQSAARLISLERDPGQSFSGTPGAFIAELILGFARGLLWSLFLFLGAFVVLFLGAGIFILIGHASWVDRAFGILSEEQKNALLLTLLVGPGLVLMASAIVQTLMARRHRRVTLAMQRHQIRFRALPGRQLVEISLEDIYEISMVFLCRPARRLRFSTCFYPKRSQPPKIRASDTFYAVEIVCRGGSPVYLRTPGRASEVAYMAGQIFDAVNHHAGLRFS